MSCAAPSAEHGAPDTVAGLLRARADDDATGVLFEHRRWTWRQVVVESSKRAELALHRRSPGPFHIGILLENVPDYLFWLGAAALAGAVAVGINPTRRGAALARDVRDSDCQLLVTDHAGAELLAGLHTALGEEAVIVIDDKVSEEPTTPMTLPIVQHQDLFLLLFTSGTTGDPKAVRCTHGRLAAIAARTASHYDFRPDDVCYCPMPLFHGNAVMALWAPALATGAAVALTRRFSASGFIADVRHHGATRFTYVGTALAYVLATPPRADDADTNLRMGFGTEASGRDRQAFEERFGCTLVEGYGSSEGGVALQVGPDTPAGSLGRPTVGQDAAVCDPLTSAECPPARFDRVGRLLNANEAIGEIVNRSGPGGFEGYYRDEDSEAERLRQGWYWTGDLGYRDEDGFFYFAGRRGDWLRVDGENVAAAPVERVLERYPPVAALAVYGVADPRSGDRVMAALTLRQGQVFEPDGFRRWLAEQPDLGTKWAPRFVRICARLPLTATGKVVKEPLVGQGWECEDPVFWSPDRDLAYRRLTAEDRAELRQTLLAHGRASLAADGPAGRGPR
ncbi:MAG TPA: AMP-binding protein [Acidimicrobiales bacterium]|nr:AMP-binding protein [Acidimicrobiales bacterium]